MFRIPAVQRTALIALFLVASSVCCRADEKPSGAENATVPSIPQQLLKLVHAPEVHQELKLDAAQVKQLEQVFQRIDGQWFRARNLPASERIPLVAQLEEQVRDWFRQNTTRLQQARLLQLELQAQGQRMLLREDLGQELKLQPGQAEQLMKLAQATDQAEQKLQQAAAQKLDTKQLQEQLQEAISAEQSGLQDVMTTSQLEKLQKVLGAKFNVAGLQRIFPMAPEIIAADDWINSSPLTLQELRGKVVLLHFYAFQCGNCKANFDLYQQWQKQWGDDVVVLGIQTPETSTERDPEAVRQAASNAKLNFPILIDLESANWKNWSNTMWPTVYVIDQAGYLRLWWQGELRWEGATGDKTIEGLVDQLLSDAR